MATHIHHKSTEWATIKVEIENIKTHFATKADVIRWTVGVGLATILASFGVVNEFRKEIRQDMQKNTAMLSDKLDKLAKR